MVHKTGELKKAIILIPKAGTSAKEVENWIEQLKTDAKVGGKEYPFIIKSSYVVKWGMKDEED